MKALKYIWIFLLAALTACPAHAEGMQPYAGFIPDSFSGADQNATFVLYSASPNIPNERILKFDADEFNSPDGGPGANWNISLKTVSIANGGTGATSQQDAADALLNFSGVDDGDMLIRDGGSWTLLKPGDEDDVFQIKSGKPSWEAISVSGAPASARYVVLATDGTLANEEVLTGTANNITVTPSNTNGGNVVLDIGSNVVTLTGTQTLTNKTLTNPVMSYNSGNGYRLAGQVFTGTLNWADWAANRTLTIPDPGANASFVMTAGTQTIAGVKTFSSAPTLSTGTLTAGANLQTFPSSAQTLVGRTTTDTLTNKSLTSAHLITSLILDQSTANYTITWQNPGSARAYGIKDVNGTADFAMKDTATYTAGGVVYGDGNLYKTSAAGSSGQPLLSGGTGSPAFNTLGATAGGTGQTSWAAGDMMYASASNTLAKRSIGSNNQVWAVVSGSPNWASLSSLGVSTVADSTCVGGRLSVSSTNPCASGNSSSLYYVPYTGNAIALYNGSTWQTCTFSTITRSLTGLSNNTNYDVFVYDSNSDGVAETLDLVAWSTDTARATSLAQQNGIYVKSGATTRRYVGTIRIVVSGVPTVFDTDGVTADPGRRFICNYYNRFRRYNHYTVGTSTWTYGTATTRPWNNTMAPMEYVKCGVPEDDPVIGNSTLYASGANQAFNTFASSAASFDILGSMHSGSNTGDLGSMSSQIFLRAGNMNGYFTITPSETTNGSNMTFYQYSGAGSNPTAGACFETYQ